MLGVKMQVSKKISQVGRGYESYTLALEGYCRFLLDYEVAKKMWKKNIL